MRLHAMPSSLVALISLSLLRPVTASFFPELLRSFEDLQDVAKRCDNPCGYYGQLCCEQGETCYTDSNNQAQCGAVVSTVVQSAAGGGAWHFSTTTYVMTDLQTVTQTLSWQDSAPTDDPCDPCSGCKYSLGETPCGNVCCKSGQYCQTEGMCVAVGGGSSGYYSSLYTQTVYNTVTAPARPTSNTLVTVTQTSGGGIYTTTEGFIQPSGTNGAIITGPSSGGGGGLSAGAIAGIVIGVIAALIILLLICACCCFKGLIDGLLGIFGLGPRRRRTVEVDETYERRSHRDSRAGRTWFGTRPGRRTSVVDEKKESSGWGRVAGVSAFLGGLALLLGMKRKRDRRDDKSSTGYGSSYFSDYTSSSESSSDRRTRRTDRSRSRASRAQSRASRR